MSGQPVAVKTGRWPAPGEIVPVGDVSIRVKPGEHPLLLANRAAVAENWQREVAANPALFDGRLIMLDRLHLEAGAAVIGEGYEIPYALHLWWRRQADPSGGIHLFSWAVPVTADGAVIAAEMAAHTANPGLVYCAAGSLEPEDVVDGMVDIAANMAREVQEEIGLRLADTRPGAALFALAVDNRVNLFRLYHVAETAEALLPRLRAFLADGGDGEIADVVAIRSADPAAHRYSPLMPPILRHVFARHSI